MQWKNLIKSSLPLMIGVVIGASFTKNKSVFYILLTLMIVRVVYSMISDRIVRIKAATDKKMAIRNETVDTLNSAIDFTEYGNKLGGKIFDKFYSDYIFFLNIAIIIYLIYLLITKQWMYSLITFIGLNTFIILNQIVRKVKYLDVQKPEPIYIPIGKKDEIQDKEQ